MPLHPTETRTIPSVLAGIERRMTEARGLAELLPALADADYRDSDDASALRTAAARFEAAVSDHITDIEAEISALRRAESEIPIDGEISHGEHVAQERRALMVGVV